MDYKALGDARDLWLPTSWRVQNTYFSSRIVCSRIIYTEKEYFYTRRHTHDFFEVQYITEGNSVFETEVDSYSVGAGDFILCAPEGRIGMSVWNRGRLNSDLLFIWIVFPRNLRRSGIR